MKDFHNAVQYRVGIEASIIYLVLFSFLFFFIVVHFQGVGLESGTATSDKKK